MVQVTFEVPDRLLGDFYVAVGVVLKKARNKAEDAAETEPHEWGTESFDDERAKMAWRKFSPRAQAVFSLLMDNPGVAMTADDIASKTGLANGRHGVAGIVAWPSRQCAELGMMPPFRFENLGAPSETGSYWMDPQTAAIFTATREVVRRRLPDRPGG